MTATLDNIRWRFETCAPCRETGTVHRTFANDHDDTTTRQRRVVLTCGECHGTGYQRIKLATAPAQQSRKEEQR